MLKRIGIRHLAVGVFAFMLASGSAFASSFNFPFPAKVGDVEVKAGRYNVTWQHHSPEVTVNVNQGKRVVATSQGRMETRNTKYARNSVIFTIQEDGSKKLSELRIGGTNTAIVFDK